MDFAEEIGIKLIYLPPYSPDLNPIEFIWKSIKKVISKTFIVDVDHMKDIILSVQIDFLAFQSPYKIMGHCADTEQYGMGWKEKEK